MQNVDYTVRKLFDYGMVYSFNDMSQLEDAKLMAKKIRENGHRTRIVYRGPRPRPMTMYHGTKCSPASTLKRHAVRFNVYVYFGTKNLEAYM